MVHPQKLADLEALGISTLTDDAAKNVKEKTIRRAYLRLSKQRHPDKEGGSEESFQRLVAAYERLTSRNSYGYTTIVTTAYEAAATSSDDDEKEDDGEDHRYEYYDDGNDSGREYWYDQHYNFFQRASQQYGSNSSNEDDYDTFFENWHKSWRREFARRRRMGIDERDRPSNNFLHDTGMFCGENAAIQKNVAVQNGLNWKEYTAHPCSYKICWGCKDSHKSVMTEKMACKAFDITLHFTETSNRTGNLHRPVFWFLKLDKKTFRHQPVVKGHEGNIRNSEYFWYPDLEQEALKRGWKPHGGKKKAGVPWQRKDVRNTTALVVTPDGKKKKSRSYTAGSSSSKKRKLAYP